MKEIESQGKENVLGMKKKIKEDDEDTKRLQREWVRQAQVRRGRHNE
jgi:hypothetical protein